MTSDKRGYARSPCVMVRAGNDGAGWHLISDCCGYVRRCLGEIADSIRSHCADLEEDRFNIGHDLLEARARFPSDREFGAWVEVQGFPFTRQWRSLLMRAAEHEPEVRAALESQLSSGEKPNIEKAVRAVLHPPAEEPEEHDA